MELIRAGREHVPAIEEIEKACFSDPWPADMIVRMLGRFFVAQEGGAVLGYIVLSSVIDEGSVDNVAVAPGHRRRGVAGALLADAERRAREAGLSFLTLEVRASNAAAIALYRKYAFAEVGRRRNYYEKPREDAILMTKVL